MESLSVLSARQRFFKQKITTKLSTSNDNNSRTIVNDWEIGNMVNYNRASDKIVIKSSTDEIKEVDIISNGINDGFGIENKVIIAQGVGIVI